MNEAKALESKGNLQAINTCELLAASLLGASRKVGQDLICPIGKGPTSDQRSMLIQAAADIRRTLDRQPADQALALAILARLLTSYPTQAGVDQTMETRLNAYATATEVHPGWIINEAAQRWLQARSGLDGANYAFAPSPSQMAQICEQVADGVRLKISYLGRAASITEDAPPPDDKRRAEFLSEMQAKHGRSFGLGANDKASAETLAEVRRRISEAN